MLSCFISWLVWNYITRINWFHMCSGVADRWTNKGEQNRTTKRDGRRLSLSCGEDLKNHSSALRFKERITGNEKRKTNEKVREWLKCSNMATCFMLNCSSWIKEPVFFMSLLVSPFSCSSLSRPLYIPAFLGSLDGSWNIALSVSHLFYFMQLW